VERSAHFQPDNPFRARLSGQGGGALHRRNFSGDYQLPGAVEVGRRYNAFSPGRRAELLHLLALQPHHRGHGSPARWHRLLHKAAPLLNQGESIVKIKRFCRHQGAVFAKAQAGRRLRREAQLRNHPVQGSGNGYQSRLGIFCSLQLPCGAAKGSLQKFISQHPGRLIKNSPRRRVAIVNIPPHAYLLGSLAWK
jgi:hypothetical protein